MKRKLTLLAALITVIAGGVARAGPVNSPFSQYTFPGHGFHRVILLSGEVYDFDGQGATLARSEDNPLPYPFGPPTPPPAPPYTPTPGPVDAVNAELVDLVINGLVNNLIPATLRVGANNGVFPGLAATTGQILDYSGPPNGVIDFPAYSFFDVFFDIALNTPSGSIVLRNFDMAARMANPNLLSIPPGPEYWRYELIAGVLAVDPLLGFIDATLISPGNPQIPVYFVNPDGSQGALAGFLVTAVHDNPEPSTIVTALFGAGGLVIMIRRRSRQTRTVQTAG